MSTRYQSACPHCGNHDWIIPMHPDRNVVMQCSDCHKDYLWQPPTQLQFAAEPCNSLGTSGSAVSSSKNSQKILDLLDQVTALHLKCAGISYGLSDKNLYSDNTAAGTSDQEKLADKASATFVKLQSTLFNLFTLAKIAEDNLIVNLKELDSNTGGPTRTL